MQAHRHIEEPNIWERGKDEYFSLPTPDNFVIYGTMNKAIPVNKSHSGTAEKLLILAHGLTGYCDQYIFMLARDYFTARGYDVIRFNFYSDGDKGRRLRGCLLQTHIQDLNQVLDHFRNGYKSVYIAGHSYGGMTALVANPDDVNAISLWDSSLYPYKDYWDREARFVPEIDCYALYPRIEALVSRAMVEESISYDRDKMEKVSKRLKMPAQIIVAGSHVTRPGQKQVFDMLTVPKDYYEIEGAHHDFCENDSAGILMDKTYEWFERF